MSAPSEHPFLDAGIEAYDAGDAEMAAAKFAEALKAGEDQVKAWTNLAGAQRALGRVSAAAACALRSLTLDPANAEGWGVLGAAQLDQERFEAAAASFRKAILFDPDEALFHGNLGKVEQRLGRLDAALAALERASELTPDAPGYQFQRATTLLQLERYAEAWPLYERRFAASNLSHRGFDRAPVWDGAPLNGRRLMIYAEQGLGDAIQFARFLPEALARAGEGEVMVETLPPLIRLFQRAYPSVQVIGCGDDRPAFDVRQPLTSLPGLFGLTPEAGLRPDGGYLPRPASGPPHHRPRVGLVWRGNKLPWDRSCPFPLFLGLTEAQGVDFVSLQRGGREDIAQAGAELLIEDPTPDLKDFADDARIAADLDLVITIDTSSCHFAGALGLPVWCLLGSHADWRFPPAGETTRWYPTMRLFRMTQHGGWPELIERTTEALNDYAASKA